MGTPTGSERLRCVLGDLRVPASEMTRLDWLQLVQQLVHRHHAHFRYLSGFQELGDILNDAEMGTPLRSTLPKNMKFLDGRFSPTTRCIVIGGKGAPVRRDDLGIGTLYEHYALMNQGGDFLQWEAKYVGGEGGFFATECTINSLSQGELVDFNHDGDMVHQLLFTLRELSERDLAQKKDRFEHAQAFDAVVKGILGRLS